MKKDMARLGNQTIGLPVIGLTVPGLQMLGGSAQKAHTAWMVATPLNLAIHPTHVVVDSWPHGRLDQERQSNDSRSMHGILALRRNSAVVTTLACLTTRRQKLARRVALSTFQQFHHVLPRVCVFETGDVPILFSLAQMKNLGMTIELYPKGDKNYMSSFGSVSTPQWDILCWTGRILRISQRPSRVEPVQEKSDADTDDEDLLPLVPRRPPPVAW